MKKKCFRSLLFMIAMTSLFACSSDDSDAIVSEGKGQLIVFLLKAV